MRQKLVAKIQQSGSERQWTSSSMSRVCLALIEKSKPRKFPVSTVIKYRARKPRHYLSTTGTRVSLTPYLATPVWRFLCFAQLLSPVPDCTPHLDLSNDRDDFFNERKVPISCQLVIRWGQLTLWDGINNETYMIRTIYTITSSIRLWKDWLSKEKFGLFLGRGTQ